MAGKPPVLLHLGCGRTRIDGWVNCDFTPTPTADVVFDAQSVWPFEDNSVREIYASHMLEHLADFWTFFREAHRVLQPNGTIVLRTPYGGHRLAWTDPTHLRPWYAESFCFLQPGYGESVGNPQHRWDAPFAVQAVDLRVSGKFAPILRWRFGRRLLLPWLENIENAVEEVWAWLYALKTPDAVDEFRSRREPFTLPAHHSMYAHQLRGDGHLKPGDKGELVRLKEYDAIHDFHV